MHGKCRQNCLLCIYTIYTYRKEKESHKSYQLLYSPGGFFSCSWSLRISINLNCSRNSFTRIFPQRGASWLSSKPTLHVYRQYIFNGHLNHCKIILHFSRHLYEFFGIKFFNFNYFRLYNYVINFYILTKKSSSQTKKKT